MEHHPTAIVDPGATLGEGVRVGPYAVVEQDVVVGAHTVIGPHAVLHRFTRLGAGNRISAHAVIGGLPQDRHFDGAESWVEIGEDNVIREGVTINRATRAGAATKIGSGCTLLAYSHVGHDCQVGDGVVLSNNVMLGGYVEIGERATLGGNAGVHQHARVGTLAMVAGYIAVRRDVLPYCLVAGEPEVILSHGGKLQHEKALEALMSELGLAEELIEQVRAFSTANVSIKDIIPAIRPDGQLARLLIRDAVELMSRHGIYSPAERRIVGQAARELGVRPTTVKQIEVLVELERSTERLHQTLFFGE